jgi:hypothetical protein
MGQDLLNAKKFRKIHQANLEKEVLNKHIKESDQEINEHRNDTMFVSKE